MLAQLVGLVGFQAVDELMKIAVIVRCGHTSRLRHRGGTRGARPAAETPERDIGRIEPFGDFILPGEFLC